MWPQLFGSDRVRQMSRSIHRGRYYIHRFDYAPQTIETMERRSRGQPVQLRRANPYVFGQPTNEDAAVLYERGLCFGVDGSVLQEGWLFYDVMRHEVHRWHSIFH